jgi:hypothetical protein
MVRGGRLLHDVVTSAFAVSSGAVVTVVAYARALLVDLGGRADEFHPALDHAGLRDVFCDLRHGFVFPSSKKGSYSRITRA